MSRSIMYTFHILRAAVEGMIPLTWEQFDRIVNKIEASVK
jgi:hypothetical protein